MHDGVDGSHRRDFSPCDGLKSVFWLSRLERRHTANVAVRPQVAITIFDSAVAILALWWLNEDEERVPVAL